MENLSSQGHDVEKGIFVFRNLQSKYNPEVLDFNYCNGYILQSTRSYFEYHCDEENIVILSKKDGVYVITTYVANDFVTFIKKLLNNLEPDRLIIKNVSKTERLKFIEAGFRECAEHEKWDEVSKYDDNTFPELVVDCDNLVKLNGPDFQSLREDVARFNRDYSISVEKFNPDDFNVIKDLFDKWVNNMRERNGWPEDQLTESTKVLFTDKFGIINYIIRDSRNNKIIGWMNFSEISNICLGFNVLVNNFDYYNLYRIMMIEAAKIAQELGYKYLNLQGSEDEGQFSSKLRMKPEIQLEKVHLIYDKGFLTNPMR
ncbi:MAG: hypothetical protein JWN37_724 [Candidatus Nomurabacteria bacterium]|nr:hypothetical protein [Candidatus Nomurabacteria bacterium]